MGNSAGTTLREEAGQHIGTWSGKNTVIITQSQIFTVWGPGLTWKTSEMWNG